MKSVIEIAEEIVAREGGYVNDPHDPGGATKYGVTLNTMRRLGMDMNRDGRVSISDLHHLTRADAVRIYVENYYDRPGIAGLPDVLQASVFDMYVNAGGNAVRVLQRLLTELGFPCLDDGVLGAKTLYASKRAYEVAPEGLADAYGIARRNYYYALADMRPASRKFARRRDGGKGGWIVRAEEFISPRFHLSDAQHRARVAKWG